MPVSRQKTLVFTVVLVAILAMLVPVIVVEKKILTQTEGNITLPQDQSFINVVVGKNLAFYGVWGLSRRAFQPAASSLLYPVLLVPFFFIAGAHLIIPVVLNAIAAMLLLWVLQKELVRRGLSPGVQLTVLLLFIFFTPLPILVISGMEYTLFLLMLALFVTAFIRKPDRFKTVLFAFLLVATRYEGLVIIAIACGMLVYRGKGIAALKIGLAGLLPIILFGLLSISKSERFLPPALLQPPGMAIYITAGIGCLVVIMTLLTPLHYKRQWLASSLFGIFAVIRTASLTEEITQASLDTWRREMPVVRFIHRYHPWDGISLNETGVLSYFSEGDKIDLTGLANYSTQRGNQRRHVSPVLSDSLSWWAYAHIGILSGSQAGIKPAGHWGKVAVWNISGDMVSFYALDTATGRRLRNNMKEYQPGLTRNIRVSYY